MANLPQQIKLSFSIENIEAHPHFHAARWLIIAVLLSLALGLSWQLYAFYRVSFYPQTTINGVDVSNLSLAAAQEKLQSERPTPPEFTLVVVAEQTSVASRSSELQALYAYTTAVPEIFAAQQQVHPWQKLARLVITKPQSFSVPIVVNSEHTTALVATLAQETNKPSVPAAVTLKYSGSQSSITIQPGIPGNVLDQPATLQVINTALSTYNPNGESQNLTVTALKQTTQPPLTEQQQTELKTRAQKLVSKSLTLMAQRQSFIWNDQELVSLLNPYLDATKPESYLDTVKLAAALDRISTALPNHPIDAQFSYDPSTLAVTSFNPGKDGLVLNTTESTTIITTALVNWITEKSTDKLLTLDLKVSAQPPSVSLGQTNNLGIAEVVGFGESYYAHSIPTRVHNVALTAKKVNLTIVKPGQEFSFNKTIGEVSAATGFKPAYVIKSGKTELGDGGGVCQVSSTLFRALLNGGLKITLRRPHSYRVTYYELNSQPGFDATVYDGNVDLRFINDTPGHLLIATETDSTKLWMKVEIYGTKDGRVSEITDYKTWGATPAKPTEYIPDASLPPGKKKQIDWPAAGLKTSFKYTVRDATGNIKQQETYTSNYQAWSAKYLVGQ